MEPLAKRLFNGPLGSVPEVIEHDGRVAEEAVAASAVPSDCSPSPSGRNVRARRVEVYRDVETETPRPKRRLPSVVAPRPAMVKTAYE